MFEVQSAQWIMQQPNIDPSVKQAAQMIVDDHTAANNQLKDIASKNSLTVPQSIPPKYQTMLDQLKSASGGDAVKQWRDQQIRAHQDAIALFQRASTTVQNSELKSFAQQTLPKLQMHLQQLQQLNPSSSSSGNSGGTSDSDTSGSSSNP